MLRRLRRFLRIRRISDLSDAALLEAVDIAASVIVISAETLNARGIQQWHAVPVWSLQRGHGWMIGSERTHRPGTAEEVRYLRGGAVGS